MLTVVIIAIAVASLIVVGIWVKDRQPRRVPVSASSAIADTPGAVQDEILPEERDALDHVLKQGGKQ